MKKIFKTIKSAAVFSLFLVFLFSDFASFLPEILKSNKLADSFKIQEARAAIGDGVFIYDQTTPTTNVQSRAWVDSTSTVGSATSPFAGSGVSKHVYAKGSQTRQEILLGIQDSVGLLTVYKSVDDGASWVSQWTASVGDGNLKRFEIAYEQISGDALVFYSSNAATPNEIKYQIWNGTAWSGALNFDPIRTSGVVYGIRAAERSGSDEIAIIWVDTNLDISANVWTGGAWYGEPSAALSTSISRSGGAAPSAVPTRRGYDLAFESLSGDLMVVWGDDSGSLTQIDPKYMIKPAGGAWGSAISIVNLTEDGEMIDIAPSPISDKIAFSTCSVDTGADCNAIVWSGAAWGAVSSDTSSAAAIIGESSNNVEWLVDGANEVAIMTYSDGAGGGIDWRTAANGTTIVSQADNTAAPAIVGLERAGFSKVNPNDSREAIFIFEDANADIFVKIAYLTGTTVVWSNPTGLATAIETNTSVTGFNPVGFAFQRFAPPPANPDAVGFTNNTEGGLTDGGRSSQQITVTGTNFGAGPSNGTTNAVKIGTYIVPNGNVTTWNATTIIFTIPAAAAVYGGIGANGLIIRAGGIDDTTPLTFYIYPNISSITTPYSPLDQAKIGDIISVSGDHFGVAAGNIIINTKSAAAGTWTETSLTNVRIPGQEGAANIGGKIQITRSDGKTSNQYPSAGNFTILAPAVSNSIPGSATTGQAGVNIIFGGGGIDTDKGSPTVDPVLKLTKGRPADCAASATCIIGTSYSVNTAFQEVSANFDLTGAATGWWKLAIVNMDGQSGSYGDEATYGFYINAAFPVVTGINPDFGLNSGIASITSITGNNFQSNATAKLTRGVSTINQVSAFTYNAGNGNLENGSFDLTGQTPDQWWNVVVINPDLQSGSYGDENTFGFKIVSAMPSVPSNLSQSKTQGGASVAVGGGIGGQTTIWFRMDMQGGLIGEDYFPQVEVQPVGAAFTGVFTEGPGVMFNGAPVQGWVSVIGTDNTSYHWQARARNSAGTSNWVSFGGNNDPNEIDAYIDNNLPVISPGTNGTCDNPGTAAINITDLGATIRWNTSDLTSGAQTPPGSGSYATAQVEYRKTTGFVDWTSTPGALSPENPREGVLHQIALSGLTPSTGYTYRMISKDIVNNIGYSPVNCTLTTTSTRPIKTVEYFIGQETAQNTGGQIVKPFSIYIPESPGAEIDVKSAFIEITGISSASANKMINVELRRDNGLFAGTGTNYAIDSTGTTTFFTILFDAMNPNIGEGNEGMADDIITGAARYDYTLYLNGGTVAEPVSAFSAKLIITYSYVQ